MGQKHLPRGRFRFRVYQTEMTYFPILIVVDLRIIESPVLGEIVVKLCLDFVLVFLPLV